MSNQTITVQGLYACAAVRDFEGAIDWYSKLIGRAPDDRPMPEMVQWRNLAAAGIQLWHEPEHAGHGRMTIVVPVMAQERARIEAAGIALPPDLTGPFGVIVELTDPDGNRIALAEPPKGFVNR